MPNVKIGKSDYHIIQIRTPFLFLDKFRTIALESENLLFQNFYFKNKEIKKHLPREVK